MYKFSKSKMKRGISHNLKQVQKRVTETFSVSTCIEQNIIKESINKLSAYNQHIWRDQNW